MVLPFNNNVPQGPQIIAATQAPILQNFQSLDSAFNDTTNGNFTKYVFQNVGTPSGAAPVNPTSILHTSVDSLGNPALFFRNSVVDGQVTGPVVLAQSGQAFLFGGLVMKWGLNAVNAPVVFPVPFSNSWLNIQLTAYANGNQYNVTGPQNPTGFTFSSVPAGGFQFFWLAIGF